MSSPVESGPTMIDIDIAGDHLRTLPDPIVRELLGRSMYWTLKRALSEGHPPRYPLDLPWLMAALEPMFQRKEALMRVLQGEIEDDMPAGQEEGSLREP